MWDRSWANHVLFPESLHWEVKRLSTKWAGRGHRLSRDKGRESSCTASCQRPRLSAPQPRNDLGCRGNSQKSPFTDAISNGFCQADVPWLRHLPSSLMNSFVGAFTPTFPFDVPRPVLWASSHSAQRVLTHSHGWHQPCQKGNENDSQISIYASATDWGSVTYPSNSYIET